MNQASVGVPYAASATSLVTQDQVQQLIGSLQIFNASGSSSNTAKAPSIAAENSDHHAMAFVEGSASHKPTGKFLTNCSMFWIIDLEASNHIACDRSLFSAISNIAPTSVSWPNGVFFLLHNEEQ